MADAEPLTRADLIGALSKGSKPKDQWRIGAEHEKFGFDRSTLRRPAYEGPSGIKAMLEGLTRFGWERVEEAGHVIALERTNDDGLTASTPSPRRAPNRPGEWMCPRSMSRAASTTFWLAGSRAAA